tara:strand:- start:33 stop:290 length:258 start_codon:yes stop_codon:yes gene_type:complete
MTKKKAPGRNQKALVILGANLSTVEEQENELIMEISFLAHLCAEMARFIKRGDPGRDVFISSMEECLSDASRGMRKLRRLQREAS